MLNSESSPSRSFHSPWTSGLRRLAVVLALTVAASVVAQPNAAAQDFSLTMAPFPVPDAITPGASTSTNITLTGTTGFNATVDLACSVTPQPTIGTPPTCQVSPASLLVDPSAGATVTVTGGTAPLQYSITVTGTTHGTTQTHSQSQDLTVEAVSPQFTVTVQTPMSPTSVVAGSGSTGIVSINPVNGYVSPGTTGVTLTCISITPLVTIPPVCSFNPPSPTVNGVAVTSTITITSFGPIIIGAAPAPRTFYAAWLPFPMLLLAGLGAGFGGKRSRKVWAVLGLFVLCASILLIPACATNGSTQTTTPNGTTPSNNYQFILAGVDANGNISSNSGSGSTNPTVSLSVTAPH